MASMVTGIRVGSAYQPPNPVGPAPAPAAVPTSSDAPALASPPSFDLLPPASALAAMGTAGVRVLRVGREVTVDSSDGDAAAARQLRDLRRRLTAHQLGATASGVGGGGAATDAGTGAGGLWDVDTPRTDESPLIHAAANATYRSRESDVTGTHQPYETDYDLALHTMRTITSELGLGPASEPKRSIRFASDGEVAASASLLVPSPPPPASSLIAGAGKVDPPRIRRLLQEHASRTAAAEAAAAAAEAEAAKGNSPEGALAPLPRYPHRLIVHSPAPAPSVISTSTVSRAKGRGRGSSRLGVGSGLSGFLEGLLEGLELSSEIGWVSGGGRIASSSGSTTMTSASPSREDRKDVLRRLSFWKNLRDNVGDAVAAEAETSQRGEAGKPFVRQPRSTAILAALKSRTGSAEPAASKPITAPPQSTAQLGARRDSVTSTVYEGEDLGGRRRGSSGSPVRRGRSGPRSSVQSVQSTMEGIPASSSASMGAGGRRPSISVTMTALANGLMSRALKDQLDAEALRASSEATQVTPQRYYGSIMSSAMCFGLCRRCWRPKLLPQLTWRAT
jgi:hypothetical protein